MVMYNHYIVQCYELTSKKWFKMKYDSKEKRIKMEINRHILYFKISFDMCRI